MGSFVRLYLRKSFEAYFVLFELCYGIGAINFIDDYRSWLESFWLFDKCLVPALSGLETTGEKVSRKSKMKRLIFTSTYKRFHRNMKFFIHYIVSLSLQLKLSQVHIVQQFCGSGYCLVWVFRIHDSRRAARHKTSHKSTYARVATF